MICSIDCKCGKHIKRMSEANPNWKGKQISRRSMHSRVESSKGKANTHDCVDCGKQARDWSRTHMEDQFNIDSYEARCRSCHLKYDRNPWELDLYNKKKMEL